MLSLACVSTENERIQVIVTFDKYSPKDTIDVDMLWGQMACERFQRNVENGVVSFSKPTLNLKDDLYAMWGILEGNFHIYRRSRDCPHACGSLDAIKWWVARLNSLGKGVWLVDDNTRWRGRHYLGVYRERVLFASTFASHYLVERFLIERELESEYYRLSS